MTAVAQTSAARRLRAALVLGVAILVGILIGLLITGGPWSPRPVGGSSAEAGFARDMQTHHLQGAEMALLIRDRTQDEEVRYLATDLLLTQQQQSGQLFGWLTGWGLPQASTGEAVEWMTAPLEGGGHDQMPDHGTSAGGSVLMPGLVTPAQIAELTAATGADADALFLELMITHHEGALTMSEAVLERGEDPMVLTFADVISTSQRREIAQMRDMLAARRS
ncbi:DUF305 domain-containing protein [Rathayibacter sp. SD072]|uniref:DUF305 domain-containing protein n=1 Tax=Rathayibacter sp. SD072 TaxID=2781731 RepID=UPI001A95F459|nr:DUF305 domain-containing protein [Rathayibacter sp. SD072]MBO0983715.1 DUF305 domain-containing protein [Rathayibacter sp. SD072]